VNGVDEETTADDPAARCSAARSSWRRVSVTSWRLGSPGAGGPATGTVESVRFFRQGLLDDLADPKMAALFLSLLPAVLPRGQASWAGFVLLGALCCALAFLWLTGYALLLDRARQLFGLQRVCGALDAISGGVLVGLGVGSPGGSGRAGRAGRRRSDGDDVDELF